MSVLSVVTIRVGSKGVKDKCTQKIGTKAVFEYTVEYSLGLGEQIGAEVYTLVSSNSPVVRSYCQQHGVPFIERKPELATDTARIDHVLSDAYRQTGKPFNYISLLYGNIPTRFPDEFARAYDFLEANRDYDAAISMHNVEKYNPAWMFELNPDLLQRKKEEGYRRQDLKQFMVPDGHTVLIRAQRFMKFIEENRPIVYLYDSFGEKIKPVLNDKLVIDIDSPRDAVLAQAVLQFGKY